MMGDGGDNEYEYLVRWVPSRREHARQKASCWSDICIVWATFEGEILQDIHYRDQCAGVNKRHVVWSVASVVLEAISLGLFFDDGYCHG